MQSYGIFKISLEKFLILGGWSNVLFWHTSINQRDNQNYNFSSYIAAYFKDREVNGLL